MYTIEELEKKSDGELNVMVASKERLKWHLTPYSKSNDTPHWVYCENWNYLDGESVYLPNCCNSWADMGPIAQKNKIEIRWNQVDKDTCIAGVMCGRNYYPYCKSTNPTRAIAIVYLMIGDVV